MQEGRTDPWAAAELRELVQRLERSGLAERRPDVRRLLESSRSLLNAGDRPRPVAAPRGRRLAGKLRALLVLALDAGVLLGFLWGSWSVLTHRGPMLDMALQAEVAMALAGPAWLLVRQPGVREVLHEAGFFLLYHLAWGWDWFAEAFSHRAMRRLGARIAAREVMRSWRRRRRTLLHRPGPPDVEAFLETAYGPRAAEAFRLAASRQGEGGWSLRGGGASQARRGRAAARLAALRWSVLVRLFEGLAASGALWPETEAEAEAEPGAPHLPEAESLPAAPPEAGQRGVDLRDLIRRRRQDITTAYGWKLKTEAEIAQRDAYLRQVRKELAELERELSALGG